MPKRTSSKKAKRDFSQAAFDIVQRLTSEKKEESDEDGIKSALENEQLRRVLMREMGRMGGKKGGKARAASLTVEQRKILAANAANVRWGKNQKSD